MYVPSVACILLPDFGIFGGSSSFELNLEAKVFSFAISANNLRTIEVATDRSKKNILTKSPTMSRKSTSAQQTLWHFVLALCCGVVNYFVPIKTFSSVLRAIHATPFGRFAKLPIKRLLAPPYKRFRNVRWRPKHYNFISLYFVRVVPNSFLSQGCPP